jgi:hypothetical protein
MARTIIANVPRGRHVDRDLVDETQKGVIGVIRALYTQTFYVSGGEESRSKPDGYNYGEISSDFEIPGKGAVDLVASYIYDRKHKSDSFSSIVRLRGLDEVWQLNGHFPIGIKRYFLQKGMLIYRDEICTQDGVKFVKGAEFTGHMEDCHRGQSEIVAEEQ